MSNFKMCDRDGGMFSTNKVGWATATMTIHRKYDDGSKWQESSTLDFCPECVADMTGGEKMPMPALEGSPLPRQTDRPLR